MAVVVTGTTLPVSLFALWLMGNNGAAPEKLLWGTAVAAVVTLLGALAALLVVYRLLAPLRHAADAMDAYHHNQTMPSLPAHGEDDMARLMRGINRCLRAIDADVRTLERHALQDTLTGAMNRRGCEQALRDSVARARNQNVPFVLFVVDLDNLKIINDELGHAAGDTALCELVASAQRWLRADDWIGRWGGDEFLIGVSAAQEPARERVGQWLQALAQDPDDVGSAVLVSAGCASWRDQDAMNLYRQADAAMYQAKYSGGHRLVCDGVPNAIPITKGAAPARCMQSA